ncbi:MAG: VOC family protein [Paracoccaceae bacterium]
MRLDHLAICAADLDAGCAWAEATLGVSFRPGGRHDLFGTHNRLLGLGDLYLEVIAPEPGATSHGRRWFGLDDWAGPPALAQAIFAVEKMEDACARLPSFGPPVELSRGGLRWRMACHGDGEPIVTGGMPALIEWGPGGAHPAQALPDEGLRVEGVTLSHTTPMVELSDPLVRWVTGPPGIELTLGTPAGRIRL